MQLSLKEKLQIVVSRFDEFSNQKYVRGYDSKIFDSFKEALSDLYESSRELSEHVYIGGDAFQYNRHTHKKSQFGVNLNFTKEEYYYLSCILGHLVPDGEISKSLLEKFDTLELDTADFDRVEFKSDTIGGHSMQLNEFNLEN
jgi:hypothetical protein